MTALYNTFFLLQFLVAVGITGFKVYNVFSSGEAYSFKAAVIMFLGYLVTWFVGLLLVLLEPEQLLFSMLYQLEVWLLSLNVLFFIIEIFFIVRDLAKSPVTAVKSLGGQNARR